MLATFWGRQALIKLIWYYCCPTIYIHTYNTLESTASSVVLCCLNINIQQGLPLVGACCSAWEWPDWALCCCSLLRGWGRDLPQSLIPCACCCCCRRVRMSWWSGRGGAYLYAPQAHLNWCTYNNRHAHIMHTWMGRIWTYDQSSWMGN